MEERADGSVLSPGFEVGIADAGETDPFKIKCCVLTKALAVADFFSYIG